MADSASVTEKVLCSAKTAKGLACKNKAAHPDGLCATHHKLGGGNGSAAAAPSPPKKGLLTGDLLDDFQEAPETPKEEPKKAPKKKMVAKAAAAKAPEPEPDTDSESEVEYVATNTPTHKKVKDDTKSEAASQTGSSAKWSVTSYRQDQLHLVYGWAGKWYAENAKDFTVAEQRKLQAFVRGLDNVELMKNEMIFMGFLLEQGYIQPKAKKASRAGASAAGGSA